MGEKASTIRSQVNSATTSKKLYEKLKILMIKVNFDICSVKDEILREYFPLPNVLKGLLDLVERLFDVRMVETRRTDVWHADVRFFDVIDLKESSDEPIASFYLDPYAKRDIGLRMEKDAGWMVAMRNLNVHASTKPLAALVFNFQRPTNDKPSLLSFKDVAVLFEQVHTVLLVFLLDFGSFYRPIIFLSVRLRSTTFIDQSRALWSRRNVEYRMGCVRNKWQIFGKLVISVFFMKFDVFIQCFAIFNKLYSVKVIRAFGHPPSLQSL